MRLQKLNRVCSLQHVYNLNARQFTGRAALSNQIITRMQKLLAAARNNNDVKPHLLFIVGPHQNEILSVLKTHIFDCECIHKFNTGHGGITQIWIVYNTFNGTNPRKTSSGKRIRQTPT